MDGKTFSFKNVLLVGGPIGSGKTWAADRIAYYARDCARSTFSAGLRRLLAVEQQTMDPSASLQDTGQNVATLEGHRLWLSTLEVASRQGTQNIVVDGIRHRHIVDGLKDLGLSIGLLVLLPGPNVCRERIAARDADLRLAEHAVESEFADLADSADVLLRNEAAIVSDFAALSRLFDWLWSS